MLKDFMQQVVNLSESLEGAEMEEMEDVVEGGQKEGASYNFAIVYGGVHPFFDPWAFGAQAAAIDLGIPIPNVTSPQNWDQTEQNAIIDGLVAGGELFGGRVHRRHFRI